MEARCEKFIADARRPPDARMTPKQIATLRRFLFKNQSNRFTAGEQEHLFQAVSIYVAAAPAIAAAAKAAASGGNPGGGGGGRGGDADADLDDDDDDNPVLGLLEDGAARVCCLVARWLCSSCSMRKHQPSLPTLIILAPT